MGAAVPHAGEQVLHLSQRVGALRRDNRERDYSGGKKPTRGDFDAVERAAAVDVSQLDIDSYLATAQITQGSLEAVSPHVVEREAIQLAAYDDMMSRTGGPSGATWSTSTTCA
jgi:hypothetical protein